MMKKKRNRKKKRTENKPNQQITTHNKDKET